MVEKGQNKTKTRAYVIAQDMIKTEIKGKQDNLNSNIRLHDRLKQGKGNNTNKTQAENKRMDKGKAHENPNQMI